LESIWLPIWMKILGALSVGVVLGYIQSRLDKKKEKTTHFLEWCKPAESAGTQIGISTSSIWNEYAENNPKAKLSEEEHWEVYKEGILTNIERLDRGEVSVTLDNPVDSSFEKLFDIDGRNIRPEIRVKSIVLKKGPPRIRLRNFGVDVIVLQNVGSIQEVIISDCHVAHLWCQEAPEKSWPSNLSIVSSMIGKISLKSRSVANFLIESSEIFALSVPFPHETSPLLGDSNFRYVKFSNRPFENSISTVQACRNLRYHLAIMQNHKCAAILHAEVLREERKRDEFQFKLLSYLYQLFSNFGLSIWRPIGGIVALFLATTFMAYFLNGAVVNKSVDSSGWKSMLVSEDSRSARALLLSTQTMVNPLSVTSSRNLVDPENSIVLLFVFVQAFFTPVFLVFFLVAVRKRFKLQG